MFMTIELNHILKLAEFWGTLGVHQGFPMVLRYQLGGEYSSSMILTVKSYLKRSDKPTKLHCGH